MKIKLIQFGDQDILIEISNGWSENYTAHLLPIVLHIFLLEKQVLAKVFKTQDKSRKDSYFWKDSWILRVSCDAMGYWHQSVLIGENSVLEAPRKLLQGRKWCKHKCCTVSVPGVSQGVQILSLSFSIHQRRSSSLFRTHVARKDKWVLFPTHTVQRHMRSIGVDWSWQDTYTGHLLNDPTDPACRAPFLHHYLLKALARITLWVFRCRTGHNEGNRCGAPTSRGLQSQAAGQTVWAQMSAQA